MLCVCFLRALKLPYSFIGLDAGSVVGTPRQTSPATPGTQSGRRQMPRLDRPSRSFGASTATERVIGFLAASVFSCVYVIAPLYVLAAIAAVITAPFSSATWLFVTPVIVSLLLPADLPSRYGPSVLGSYACQCIPKYFDYEEYHEVSDAELQESGKNYICAAHPHGVFSFVGVCAAVASVNAADGFGPALAARVPTAAASVIKRFPLLKDILGVFGVIDASSRTLARHLSRPASSVVIYVGGMAELFRSSACSKRRPGRATAHWPGLRR